MPDYFKQAFPAVISYERTSTLEDEGVSTASGLIKYKSIVWYESRNTFEKKIFWVTFYSEQEAPFWKCNLVVNLPRTLPV